MAHPLSGADLRTLWAVFRAGGRPDHWGQAAGIWGAALARAPISALERAVIDRSLPSLADLPAPVFILGHWRSGTTHLYNILGQGDWGIVPPLAVGLPHDMFGLVRLLRPLLERQLPPTRYIDAIPVTPQSPQEDEIAIANMSPLSFYHGLYFPQQFDSLIDRGLFFDGCAQDEIDAWAERFGYFLRKLALAQGRRLMIKNPVYTARPALLRALFPGARFVHIHRNPHDVFASMRNFYAQLLRVMALQRVPQGLDIDATILRVYARMMGEYDRQTAGWAASDLVELPYADLDRDPMGAVEQIYAQLDLPGFAAAAPAFRAYLATITSYEKNRFRDDPAAAAAVARVCAPWIARWGYG